MIPGWKKFAPWVLVLAFGCKLGPDYQRPEVAVPTHWRWKSAEPNDTAPRGSWWKIFDDPSLDDLQNQAVVANQDLRAAMARVEQARATARFQGSDMLPTLNSHPYWVRYRTSGTRASPVDFHVPSLTQQQWDIPFDLTYEVDLQEGISASGDSFSAATR